VPQGSTVPWISDAAIAMLKHHGWPGNIRELENVMRRALVLAAGKAAIGAEHIVFDRPARLVTREPEAAALPLPSKAEPGAKLAKVVQLSEARAIMDTLDACGGRRAEAFAAPVRRQDGQLAVTDDAGQERAENGHGCDLFLRLACPLRPPKYPHTIHNQCGLPRSRPSPPPPCRGWRPPRYR